MYLCQVNTSEILYPVADPRFLRFSAGARIINRKVQSAPGYICGDQRYDGNNLFITRSVWESPQDLAAFIYSGIHQKFMKQAATWFKASTQPSLALWYSPDATLPDPDFCLAQLRKLVQHGESDNLKGVQWLAEHR